MINSFKQIRFLNLSWNLTIFSNFNFFLWFLGICYFTITVWWRNLSFQSWNFYRFLSFHLKHLYFRPWRNRCFWLPSNFLLIFLQELIYKINKSKLLKSLRKFRVFILHHIHHWVLDHTHFRAHLGVIHLTHIFKRKWLAHLRAFSYFCHWGDKLSVKKLRSYRRLFKKLRKIFILLVYLFVFFLL